LLDLLATFDWNRPLFFTQSYALRPLGMQEYLQFDGAVYRFVPIKTPAEDPMFIGRVDTEYLYDNVMNKYRWGGVSDPDVYVDSFVAHNLAASNGRHSHVRLAEALMAEGDTVRAIEVLDRAFEVLPLSQFRNTYMITTPAIEAYYKAGAGEKGDAILYDFANDLEEYIRYYVQFTGRWEELVADELGDKLANLQELYRIALLYNRREAAARIYSVFE
jgi:tetratricopeptide (TPR) repeat protein